MSRLFITTGTSNGRSEEQMLREVMRFECRFTYPAIQRKLKKITGEEDWMGFYTDNSDPIQSFYEYVRVGLIEKDGDEVVIYMDL